MSTSTRDGEVVLITGGSGFLGQHLIKQLLEQQAQLAIREIRTLDIVPYKNNIGHREAPELRSFVADINADADVLADAFRGVDAVFHCAAYVSIEYPPNYEQLERVNVDGTRAVVELCLQHNVKRLVYTSCASVCFVPFKGHSTFALIINQTESKAVTPRYDAAHDVMEFDGKFLIAGYSASKLRAEHIVLNSNGAPLQNQRDYLATCAIRAPLTYGECDSHFIPNVFAYLAKRGHVYPRIGGAGGKQQLVYAGNVAWGHICAYKTLKASAKAVNGLPVFVTDDSGINDVSRFVQKMALLGQQFKVKQSAWYLPHFVFFFVAFLYECFVKLTLPYGNRRLTYSWRAMAAYTSSVLMFNRLRASIHMDYVPLVDADTSAERSARWYANWWQTQIDAAKQTKGHKSS